MAKRPTYTVTSKLNYAANGDVVDKKELCRKCGTVMESAVGSVCRRCGYIKKKQ